MANQIVEMYDFFKKSFDSVTQKPKGDYGSFSDPIKVEKFFSRAVFASHSSVDGSIEFMTLNFF